MTVASTEDLMHELDKLLERLRRTVEGARETARDLRKAVSESDRPDRPAAG